MQEIYLDSAATSLIQPEVLAAGDRLVDLYKNPNLSASDVTMTLRKSLINARQSVASLIHCSSDEIALIQSTSHGLSMLADLLPLEQGDNVLMCDLEYQASTMSFMRAAERKGFEIRCVSTNNGEILLSDFKKYKDNGTKVIVLASVQEINGYRADIKEIANYCQEEGIFFVVDGIQEVGAFSVDVKELGIDFYVAGGKKWIGNPFGMGFMYMRNELVSRFKPNAYNYFTIVVDTEKYKNYISYLENPARHPFDHYNIIENASKFEMGGYANYIGAFGLEAAVNLILSKGQKNIEERIRLLTGILYDGLISLGITPCSSGEFKNQSGIVSFNFGLKDNDNSRERALVEYLQTQGIKVSLRCSTGMGGVRVSMHYYNNEDEVERLLKEIKVFLLKYTN